METTEEKKKIEINTNKYKNVFFSKKKKKKTKYNLLSDQNSVTKLFINVENFKRKN